LAGTADEELEGKSIVVADVEVDVEVRMGG
jgi:hypothetical protein